MDLFVKCPKCGELIKFEKENILNELQKMNALEMLKKLLTNGAS